MFGCLFLSHQTMLVACSETATQPARVKLTDFNPSQVYRYLAALMKQSQPPNLTPLGEFTPQPFNNICSSIWIQVRFTPVICRASFPGLSPAFTPGANCIKLLPEKNSGCFNQIFLTYGKANGKNHANLSFQAFLWWSFSLVKVLCNRPQSLESGLAPQFLGLSLPCFRVG